MVRVQAELVWTAAGGRGAQNGGLLLWLRTRLLTALRLCLKNLQGNDSLDLDFFRGALTVRPRKRGPSVELLKDLKNELLRR